MTEEQKIEEIRRLYHQLDVCGQILSDWDEEDEPTYYRREYKRICKALARLEPENWNYPVFKKDYTHRNKIVAEFCETHPCPVCGGKCKQTRSGSLRCICTQCGKKYQLHTIKVKKQPDTQEEE